MSHRFRAALGLAASLLFAHHAVAFEFEGFTTGMSGQDIVGLVGADKMQTVSGPNGRVIELSKPYSFELCDDKLVGISKIIDRSVLLDDY